MGDTALEAVLEEAAKAQKASVTPPEATVTTDSTEETETKEVKAQKAKTIPYERFSEVVDLKNRLQSQLEKVQSELNQRSSELGKATELLTQKEGDSRVVNEIRRLAQDPKWTSTIDKLDKAIRGIEDQAEEAKATADPKDTKAQELIEKTRQELLSEIHDQRQDQIIQRADLLAEKYLAALPPEYLPEDRRAISRIWTDEVNWEGIEKDPSMLNKELARSLEESLRVFGTPRGGLVRPDQVKAKEEVEAAAKKDPLELLKEVDLSAMKEVKLPSGKTLLKPQIGDQDFTKLLALEMKNPSRAR